MLGRRRGCCPDCGSSLIFFLAVIWPTDRKNYACEYKRYAHMDNQRIHDAVVVLDEFQSQSGHTGNVVELPNGDEDDINRCCIKEVNGGRDWD